MACAMDLIEAGAELKWVYDPDPAKVAAFVEKYPSSQGCCFRSRRYFDDPEVKLIAAAAVPSERGPLGIRAMEHGKDYFTDKTPFTTLRSACCCEGVGRSATGRKYAVYYSERLHVESAVFAGQLIEEGAIGRVVQVIGLGPHRLNAPTRPDWFFEKDKYGGILCDIGSHQIEQFLYLCRLQGCYCCKQ